MKIFIVAQNKELKHLVSNRGKLWRKIIERLNVCEDELIKKQYKLLITVYPMWTENDNMNLDEPEVRILYRSSAISSLLRDYKHFKVTDSRDEENSVTIWEREVE
jgi:hypothetical protein